MPATLRLGRIGGIPIGLHYSWFIIAGLITLSLAGHFQQTQAAWSVPLIWSVSALTAVLFFATLVAHELSHAIVARSHGLTVRSITLFALGGLAHIEKDAGTARTEFLIAAAGPFTSIVIGLVCIGIARPLGWSIDDGAAGVTGSVLGWLGSINVLLAIFNLIPGYPLDGGRLLRALLWSVYKDVRRATRHAARAGQAVAGIFIVSGLWQFFAGAGLDGLWLAFIGWFLMTAAQASYAEVTMSDALRSVRVSDVMAKDFSRVDPQVNVRTLVEDVLLRTGSGFIAVTDDDRLLGMVTAREVRGVDREQWDRLTAAQVMRPMAALKTVEPAAPVAEALEAMARERMAEVPVVTDGRLQGIVTRDRIAHLLQSRAELKAA